MALHRTIPTLAVFALVLSAGACGDSITQGNAPSQSVDASTASASPDGNPAPVLEVSSRIVSTSGFNGTGRAGEFLRVETIGSGFPAGVEHVERTAFVLRTGGVVMPTSAGGPFVADGSVKAAYGQSCPTPYAETFAVVMYIGHVVYSKHVPTAC
jgi:hypothetical protein